MKEETQKEITKERFIEIMTDDNIKTVFPEGDNALMGLNIIKKYLPTLLTQITMIPIRMV